MMMKLSKNQQSALLFSAIALFFTFLILGFLGVLSSLFLYALALIGVLSAFSYLLLFNKQGLIYVLFFFVPFSVTVHAFGGFGIGFPSEFLSFFLSFMVLFYAFNKTHFPDFLKILRHPITILILVNTLIFVFTSFTSSMVDVSLKRSLMRINFIVCGFVFLCLWMRQEKQLLKPFLFYGLGLSIVAIIVLFFHSKYQFDPRVAFSICLPFFDEHTVYGACLAFVLPIAFLLNLIALKSTLNPVLKIGSTILFFVLVVAEVLAFSRAAWLSIVVILVFYALLKLNISPVGFLIILLIAGGTLFAAKDIFRQQTKHSNSVSNDGNISNHISSITNLKTDASNTERLNRWVCAYRMFKSRPLVGFGPGTYQFKYAMFQTHEFKTYISTNRGDKGNAHSEYLTYLAENGVFGFISFLILVIYTLFKGISMYYERKPGLLKNTVLVVLLGLTTFFFHGVFNSFIDQDKMALLVFPALAVLVAIDVFHKPEQDENVA